MAGSPELTYPISAAYFLRPLGPLRIGTHPQDLARSGAFPGSDTLFGALAWAFQARFGGEAFHGWLGQFAGGEPPALWSSALPALVESGSSLHVLVPVPSRRPGFAAEMVEDRKLLGRVQYLHLALLPWFAGAAPASYTRRGRALLPTQLAERVQQALHTAAPRGGDALGGRQPAIATPLWDEASRPRVTVDRLSGAASLFTSSSIRFARFPVETFEAGMAVCVLVRDETTLVWLDACFEVLSETGIGGERSTGSGQFAWRRVECPLPLSPSPRGPLLSLCWPRRDELAVGALRLAEGSGYRLVERMGWIASPAWSGYRSRAVTMLAEGSFMAPHLTPPLGGLADVTPDPSDATRHPVYRYGYGCFLAENSP